MVKKPSKAQKAKARKAGGESDAAGRGGKSGRGRGKGRGGGAGAGGGRVGRSHMLPPDQQAAFEARKKTVQMEESAFSKLSPPVLERLNILASYVELIRPVSEPLTHFDYTRFGRARAEYHQRRIDAEKANDQERQAHPLAGWLNSKQSASSSGDGNGSDSQDSTDGEASEDEVTGVEETGELRLPKRPKWRADMDVKTVHSQEEEVFRQWLHKTDRVVERAFFSSSPLFAGLTSHTRSDDKAAFTSSSSSAMGGGRMVSGVASQDSVTQLLSHRPAPGTSVIGSLYERNIEVYRQLWRVCERSDLVCVLADARCPLLHLPPSLIGFLERYMRLKVIIVLTKADIVPKDIVESWKTYLKSRFPKWEIVGTESYTKMERMEGQGSRIRFAPYLSSDSRNDLFRALRKAHRDLITPPQSVRDDPEKLKRWNPPCATDTDWDGVERRVHMHAHDEGHEQDSDAPTNGVKGAEEPPQSGTSTPVSEGRTTSTTPSTTSKEGKREPLPYLTIGLIGQPNVGKSSLLNALFGAKVVRASKTPGKTKHFQTHFLVPIPSSSASSSASQSSPKVQKGNGEESHRGQIRLCDSPGLVFPSLIGMEMQVMGAILAISQVQAITSCIRFVAEHMPLEEILKLELPPDDDAPARITNASSATAREAAQHATEQRENETWTATKILEAVARRYMFKTAKANRWDLNRAGNLVMRAVAEGRIKWAFRPPDSVHESGGKGVWIPELTEEASSQDRAPDHDVLTAPNPDDDDHDDEQEQEDSDPEADKEPKKVRFEQHTDTSEESDEDDGEEDEVKHGADSGLKQSTSMFNALAVESGEDEDEDEDEEEDESDEEGEDEL